MEKEFIKKHKRYFLSGMGVAALAICALLTVSCTELLNAFKDEALENHDISDIYGYTYYGNITSSGGSTLTPSLTIYNKERVDWNMSVNGMIDTQFWYYAEKKSKNNYTLHWFVGSDRDSARSKIETDAVMTVQIGINSTDGVVILLTGDGLTGIGAMSNTRVPMARQIGIVRKLTAPEIKIDDTEDIAIVIPETAADTEWSAEKIYTGTFKYLVKGKGKVIQSGSGSSGKDAHGNEITPTARIAADGTHTVKLILPRFAYDSNMTIEPITIPGVKVQKKDGIYYFKYDSPKKELPPEEGGGIPALKADGNTIKLMQLSIRGMIKDEGGTPTLTLRTSFKPGKMPFPVVQVFTGT